VVVTRRSGGADAEQRLKNRGGVLGWYGSWAARFVASRRFPPRSSSGSFSLSSSSPSSFLLSSPSRTAKRQLRGGLHCAGGTGAQRPRWRPCLPPFPLPSLLLPFPGLDAADLGEIPQAADQRRPRAEGVYIGQLLGFGTPGEWRGSSASTPRGTRPASSDRGRARLPCGAYRSRTECVLHGRKKGK
jgi:hypothetical protein